MTYFVVATNSETGETYEALRTTSLAIAAQRTLDLREDDDGTWAYDLRHGDGSPVTRGEVRALRYGALGR